MKAQKWHLVRFFWGVHIYMCHTNTEILIHVLPYKFVYRDQIENCESFNLQKNVTFGEITSEENSLINNLKEVRGWLVVSYVEKVLVMLFQPRHSMLPTAGSPTCRI